VRPLIKGIASFVFTFNSQKSAKAIYEALEVETREGPVDRTKAILRLEEDTIGLDLEASDSASMRAGVNSYSRWINMAKSLSEV
jgi:tRNA threonylcarbamoyladenosine modification (KEOPS) complex  Pcc1 subunit